MTSPKLDMDLSAPAAACVVSMDGELDDDTLELARELCTRAGMLLEDASARAVLIGGLSAEDLTAVVRDVHTMAEQAVALLTGTQVLLRDCGGKTIG